MKKLALLLLLLASVTACALGQTASKHVADQQANFVGKLFAEACLAHLGKEQQLSEWVRKNQFQPAPPALSKIALQGQPGEVWQVRNALGDFVIVLKPGGECMASARQASAKLAVANFENTIKGMAHPGITVKLEGDREVDGAGGKSRQLVYSVQQDSSGAEWMFIASTTLVDADIAKALVYLSVSPLAQMLHRNEMPMYGGKPKSADQIKVDQDFISSAIKTTGSREAAFKAAIGSGFQSMQTFDWRTAMKRFNQAWLLMPDRAEVFWGFGAAISHQGKFEESLQYFTKAAELDPRNARMLNDFGFMYQFWASVRSQYETDKISRLKKSIELFERAAAIDPAKAHIQANWAASLYLMQDYKGAWERVKQAEQLGGHAIDPKLIRDLTEKMARPQ